MAGSHFALAQGAVVMVNDRLEIAVMVRAGGVHLPERGLPVDTVAPLLPPDMLIGCSVHSADDARRATDQGADYVFLGPIWETPSHKGRPPLGVKALGASGGGCVVAFARDGREDELARALAPFGERLDFAVDQSGFQIVAAIDERHGERAAGQGEWGSPPS